MSFFKRTSHPIVFLSQSSCQIHIPGQTPQVYDLSEDGTISEIETLFLGIPKGTLFLEAPWISWKVQTVTPMSSEDLQYYASTQTILSQNQHTASSPVACSYLPHTSLALIATLSEKGLRLQQMLLQANLDFEIIPSAYAALNWFLQKSHTESHPEGAILKLDTETLVVFWQNHQWHAISLMESPLTLQWVEDMWSLPSNWITHHVPHNLLKDHQGDWTWSSQQKRPFWKQPQVLGGLVILGIFAGISGIGWLESQVSEQQKQQQALKNTLHTLQKEKGGTPSQEQRQLSQALQSIHQHPHLRSSKWTQVLSKLPADVWVQEAHISHQQLQLTLLLRRPEQASRLRKHFQSMDKIQEVQWESQQTKQLEAQPILEMRLILKFKEEE